MFRLLTRIVRSWYSCNYSFWHWSAGSTICSVVPDSCVCSIQFSFDVFDLVKLFCLFGVNEFYTHGSVHREPNSKCVQADATVFSLLHFCIQLYMFRLLTPTIRSWYSCNYSCWHWSTGSTAIRSRCSVGKVPAQQRQ